MNALEDQQNNAREQLPALPLEQELAEQDSTVLQRYDVVVAYNLDYPYRYSQDYYWLEILAVNEIEACQIAQDWVVRIGDERWELTRLVRKATDHHTQIGTDNFGAPLPVMWNLPIDRGLKPGTIVRNPITALRVGFIAHPEDEQRWVLSPHRQDFQLITRKPVKGSDPVCLAPLVTNLSPLRYGD